MEFTEQEKKVLADKYETFKEEIELAMIQNCIVECELYSLLAEIIRGTKSGEKISLRDVSVRRKTNYPCGYMEQLVFRILLYWKGKKAGMQEGMDV